jgi:hypothetical protein
MRRTFFAGMFNMYIICIYVCIYICLWTFKEFLSLTNRIHTHTHIYIQDIIHMWYGVVFVGVSGLVVLIGNCGDMVYECNEVERCWKMVPSRAFLVTCLVPWISLEFGLSTWAWRTGASQEILLKWQDKPYPPQDGCCQPLRDLAG